MEEVQAKKHEETAREPNQQRIDWNGAPHTPLYIEQIPKAHLNHNPVFEACSALYVELSDAVRNLHACAT